MRAVVAQLRYRRMAIDVELIEGEGPRSFVIRCPACGRRSRLNEAKHVVTWNMTAGLISVEPAVLCPNPQCGWHVRIERNVVRDVSDNLPAEKPNGSKCRPGDRGYHLLGYEPRLPGSRRN